MEEKRKSKVDKWELENIWFFKVAPGGTSYFRFHLNDKELFGITEIIDATSKKSFLAIIYTGNRWRKCTIFILPGPQTDKHQKDALAI